ncbi:POK19 protein, partial [Heliornis fulica]|nr:POK19 protein [Heliornis fulica]
LLIVDLKDCFFSIPLHPSDTERFAFSVPQKNTCRPALRYEWTVLPQGMRNSPTICQWYVNLAITKWKSRYHDVIVYHYMDDILLAREQEILTEMES